MDGDLVESVSRAPASSASPGSPCSDSSPCSPLSEASTISSESATNHKLEVEAKIQVMDDMAMTIAALSVSMEEHKYLRKMRQEMDAFVTEATMTKSKYEHMIEIDKPTQGSSWKRQRQEATKEYEALQERWLEPRKCGERFTENEQTRNDEQATDNLEVNNHIVTPIKKKRRRLL